MSPALNTDETSPRERRCRRQAMQALNQKVNNCERIKADDVERLEEKIWQESLWDAVNMGQSDECKHILQRSFNPNFLHEEYGCSPLHVAVENGDVDVVKVLLNNGMS